MSITHLTSLSQLNGILSKSSNKLTIIDFHATWCGPCHAIAPVFESLSKQYTNVNFLKCDVDQASEVGKSYSVSAMPTFIFLRGSTQIDKLRGANKAGLENMIKKHATNSTTSFSGRGQTVGGEAIPPDVIGEVQNSLGGVWAQFNQLDPQFLVLAALMGLYYIFWFF